MNVINELQAIVAHAKRQSEEEQNELRQARREAELAIHAEIIADTPSAYARIQQENWERCGRLRMMEKAFCPASRADELLNTEAHIPTLLAAFEYLEVLHVAHLDARKQSLLAKVDHLVSSLVEDQESPNRASSWGIYAPDVIKTPSGRLEELRHQVHTFPGDWELERIVAQMAGLYAVLVTPAPTPRHVKTTLEQLGALFQRVL